MRAPLSNPATSEMTSRGGATDFDRLAYVSFFLTGMACDQETKRFRNFYESSREWLEDAGGGQSRASALGCGRSLADPEMTVIAIFCCALIPRGPARLYSIPLLLSGLGFRFCSHAGILRSFAGDRMVNQLRDLRTTLLLSCFQANNSKDAWFESIATYDNAKLSHAMIRWSVDVAWRVSTAGVASLRGWWKRQRAIPDIRADWPTGFLEARRRTRALRLNSRWRPMLRSRPVWRLLLLRMTIRKRASHAVSQWFLGRTTSENPSTLRHGSCRDRFSSDRVTRNQGANQSRVFTYPLAR